MRLLLFLLAGLGASCGADVCFSEDWAAERRF